MTSFDAWYLPGLELDNVAIAEHRFGDVIVRAPSLTGEQLAHVITGISSARTRVLSRMKIADIVAAIDAAAQDLASEHSTDGAAARELLPLVTGYSSRTIADVLEHMTRDWSRASLEKLLRSELGDPAVLDYPVGGRFAHGPRFAYHVFSGNVPGVAVTSIIRSLLVKAATLGKTASGEPILPVLFARALARHAPELAACLAVTYWPGGTETLEQVALDVADTVVVYGGADTVRSIRARANPNARLVVHGPKLSFGIVGKDADTSVATAIARATAAYDQQGCVSPHVVYVQTGGSLVPQRVAQMVATELAELAESQPRRKLDTAEMLAIRAARTQAEFGGSIVIGSEDTSYTVIYDEDPTLVTSCLNRTLYMKPFADTKEIVHAIERHRGVIQSVALAGFASSQIKELAIVLAEYGVTRITSFGELPWPPMWWQHDGQGPLRELVSWQDIIV